MRRLKQTLLAALLLAGCDSRPGDSERARYLDDASFRRAALVASLVNANNHYSQERLAHYARDWDALPEWNPPVALSDQDDARALALDDAQLGADAFFRYPTQSTTRADLPSTVKVRLADGSTETSLTCATCHSRTVDGDLVPGPANETIVIDPAWGAGRVDVAIPSGEEPVAIPDLRVVSLERNLHRDGTVRNLGTTALAIRIETLLITAHHAALRPPRRVVWALAEYLQSLAPAPASSASARGDALFAGRCAGCHVPPDFSGAPVDLDVVGTDPRVGESADRGTGGYRVPSLRGVGTRGRLLHDASVADVAALLDPTRAAPGHHFGWELSPDDRAALVVYVSGL